MEAWELCCRYTIVVQFFGEMQHHSVNCPLMGPLAYTERFSVCIPRTFQILLEAPPTGSESSMTHAQTAKTLKYTKINFNVVIDSQP